MPRISRAEVARHRAPDDCWFVFEGQVYDASGYATRHPGGAALVTEYAGQDITEKFLAVHSRGARKQIERMPLVGRAASPVAASPLDGPLDTRTPSTEPRFLVLEQTGQLRRAINPGHLATEDERAAHSAFRTWILGGGFPCVAGKMAFAEGHYGFGVYTELLGSKASAKALVADVLGFIDLQTNLWNAGEHFTTFVAAFPHEKISTEDAFESKLFSMLGAIHEADPVAWPEALTQDPRNPNFQFMVGGRAFFVVGLHPESSRKGRAAPMPTLVFNAMDQFRHLEKTEQFSPVQDAVRKRDRRISGSVNPNIEHAPTSASSAWEYSGKAHHQDATWMPPPFMGTTATNKTSLHP